MGFESVIEAMRSIDLGRGCLSSKNTISRTVQGWLVRQDKAKNGRNSAANQGTIHGANLDKVIDYVLTENDPGRLYFIARQMSSFECVSNAGRMAGEANIKGCG
jgi:hypothetical protein